MARLTSRTGFDMADMAEFATSSGQVLKLKPVSAAKVQAVRAGIVWPARPTYTTTTAGGGVQVHEADETTADPQEWAAYVEAEARATAEWYERLGQLLLYYGVDLEVPTGWEDDQRYFGIAIPDDPRARKCHYILTELLASPEEQKALLLAILALNQTREEAIRQQEAGF